MFNLLAIPNVVNVAGIDIALLDVVALVAICVALIYGLIKGFAKQALAILGFVAALILSFMLCGKVASFINESIPAIPEAIKGAIEKALGISSDLANTEASIREILQNSSIPAFLHELLISLIVESNFEVTLVDTMVVWSLNLISFGVLLVVFSIGFAILKGIVGKIVSLPIISVADKLLGMAFSVLKCLIIIMIVLSLASAVLPLNNYLKPEGLTCYLNNALEWITNSNLIKNILSKIIK